MLLDQLHHPAVYLLRRAVEVYLVALDGCRELQLIFQIRSVRRLSRGASGPRTGRRLGHKRRGRRGRRRARVGGTLPEDAGERIGTQRDAAVLLEYKVV